MIALNVRCSYHIPGRSIIRVSVSWQNATCIISLVWRSHWLDMVSHHNQSNSSSAMPNVELANGPYLVGVMANFALFGITCSQTVFYFRTYSFDHVFLKSMVIALFILEGVHVAFLLQSTYYVYIVCKLPEKTSTAGNIALGAAGCVTINVIITTLVQSFYAWRVYCLSVGRRWQKPLVAFICTASHDNEPLADSWSYPSSNLVLD
ncbi:hypothetical protein H2248_002935 [Termitomyces sp. 'cryptogamus']|nr:hypothetical protein H2248_002935 [Termitomyces sp. 'cryptogamus']